MQKTPTVSSGKIVLALDTSTAVASFAIAQNGQLLAALVGENPAPHSQTIFANLHTLLAQAGLGLTQIDLFAVVTGPGSFTGLRVGLSALKGVAQTVVRPILGVNAFDLVALSAGSAGEFLVVLEAGRNEVFVGKRLVDSAARLQQLTADWVGPVEMYAVHFQADMRGAVLLGSGLSRLPQDLVQQATPMQVPFAITLALHAEVLFESGRAPEPHAYYVRPSDAEVKFAKPGFRD